MHRAILITSIVFLFLFSSVHAQQVESETISDPVWDAINGILNTITIMRDALGIFKTKVDNHLQDYRSYVSDMNLTIDNLNQTNSYLQNQISTTNGTVQGNTDTINTHTQEINDLNQTAEALKQTDQNLQNQISGINGAVNRSNVYLVESIDLNVTSAFCADNSDILLFGYCSGKTLGDFYLPNSIVYDDFEDYDFTINPTWMLVAGNLAVGNSGAGVLAGKLYTVPTFGELATPVDITADQISMSALVRLHGGNSGEFAVGLTNKEGPWSTSGDTGYIFYPRMIGSNSYFSFFRVNGGNVTTLYNSSTFFMGTDIDYTVKAERNSSGYWRFYIDNIQYGPPILDNTIQTFNYAHFKLNGPFAVADDINITSIGFTAPTSSAILNINNLNAPMGVQCKYNGSARALCLRVD